ncbi:hypothetical protein OROGR_008065 [Orobanche gracilis]
MEPRVRNGVLVFFVALAVMLSASPTSAEEVEKVLTLDHSNSRTP